MLAKTISPSRTTLCHKQASFQLKSYGVKQQLPWPSTHFSHVFRHCVHL